MSGWLDLVATGDPSHHHFWTVDSHLEFALTDDGQRVLASLSVDEWREDVTLEFARDDQFRAFAAEWAAEVARFPISTYRDTSRQ